MAKRVKKKPKSGQKDKQGPSTTPKTVFIHDTSISESPGNCVDIVIDRGLCSHINKGINMDTLSAKIMTSGSFRCEDCRGHIVDSRSKKGKGGKHGKKVVNTSKSETKAIWICLECGHFSCGGIGFPTTPQSHAVRHAKQYHHPLALHYENHHLLWCFSCDKIVPIEKSEEGKLKEAFKEVVKTLKRKPGEGSNVNVEDVWLGSGSVTSAVKSGDYQISVQDVKAGYSIRGLVNLGNTCFFNSIMQNLLAIHSLREYLFELDESVGPLIASLRKFFLETNSEAGIKSAVNPRSLFGSLCTKAPQFRGYQQHDSHELLRCLLDGLSSEELSARKRNGSSNTGPTFVDTIFGGQLSSTVSCLECGHSSTIYEPFLDLSLPVPTKKPPARGQKTKTAVFGPVARGKKPKLPPKRPGRNYSKMSRETNNRPGESTSAQSTDENILGKLQTIPQPLEQVVLSPGDYASSDFIDPIGTALDTGFIVENPSSVQNPQNKQAIENVGEQSISSDSFAWLDYLGPENDIAKEGDETSAIEGLSNENALQNDVCLSITMNSKDESNLVNAFSATSQDSAEHFNLLGPLTRDQDALSPFEDKQNENSQSSEVVQNETDIGHNSESNTLGKVNENLSQIQDSQVILLPNKEMEVSSSSVPGDEQDSLDFGGFGDLFNEPEPEVSFGPVSEANTKNTIINNSESDPDEVDDSDAPVSVESCLALFTKPELLFKDEHAWQCDNCSKVMREQKIRSRSKLQLPISETVHNGCAENVTGPPEEIHENGDCTRLDASELPSENTEPLKLDACASLNNEDVNPRESDKNALAERDLLSAEHESELTHEKEDEVNLVKLKVKRDAAKTMLLRKVPSVLTIQLKRFSQDARGRLSKLNGHVNFRETIDLKPYMDPRCSEGESFRYRLVGLVEHLGSMRGGHYVAYVRGSKGYGDCVWYHASDAYVRQASLEEVLRSQAYILLYERI